VLALERERVRESDPCGSEARIHQRCFAGHQ
jgi:hypothetical protein